MESKELLRIYDSDRSEFVAIYGRRRVGKTYLVNEVLGDKMLFRHAGLSRNDMEARFLIRIKFRSADETDQYTSRIRSLSRPRFPLQTQFATNSGLFNRRSKIIVWIFSNFAKRIQRDDVDSADCPGIFAVGVFDGSEILQ